MSTTISSSSSQFTISNFSLQFPSSLTSPSLFFHPKPFPFFSHSLSISFKKSINTTSILCKSNEKGSEFEEEEDSEWLQKLPEKNKPLYSHSLPCIEAWLKKLGFSQSKDDRALWIVHKSDWHAHLSLDATDLHIRYLKNGPGNLEKDVERKFSYALSREDIENAVLGGP